MSTAMAMAMAKAARLHSRILLPFFAVLLVVVVVVAAFFLLLEFYYWKCFDGLLNAKSAYLMPYDAAAAVAAVVFNLKGVLLLVTP